MNFAYSIPQTDPVAVISMSGDLIDKNASQQLLTDVDRLAEEGHADFVFECSAMRLMNSAGLNVLIQALTHARKAGGEVVVACLPNKVRQLLLLTRLNAVFHVYDNITEALQHFADQGKK
jgi:anti-sigma B factor antagonist